MVVRTVLIVIGLLIDVWFIRTEYQGKMKKAVVLKGAASLFFVLLGGVSWLEVQSNFGTMVLIGLVLGMMGDIFLNLRNLYEGSKSMKVFALGILFFLSGHFLYIAALVRKSPRIIYSAMLTTAVLSLLAIPPLMRRVTAPNRGLRIFGWVYLAVVIAMFSSSLMLLVEKGVETGALLFSLGALLFVVSDFIMIYYSFGEKIRPLRAINLLSYYIGQILIALTVSIMA